MRDLAVVRPADRRSDGDADVRRVEEVVPDRDLDRARGAAGRRWRRRRWRRRRWRWRRRWRRRRSPHCGSDSGERIEPALAPGVVVLRRAATGSRHVDRRLIEDRLRARDVPPQARNGRPDQGHGRGQVRRGHRGAAEDLIAPAVPGRAHVDARRGDVRLDDPADRGRAPARAGRDHVVDVERSDRVALGVAPGRPDRSAARSRVPARERREDPGRDPGLDDRLVEGVAPVAVAPRVADDVGSQVRLRVLAVEVGRRHHELARRQERVGRAAVGLAALGRDPRRVRGDADLVRAGVAVVADHRAHRVRAVAVVVARGRAPAHGRGVPPVVVVVEVAAPEVAAVLRDERAVGVEDTGVDVADDDVLAAIVVRRPDLRCVDPVDAPLHGARGPLPGAPGIRRDLEDDVRDDPGHLRALGERLENRAAPRDLNRVQDPEGLERHVLLPEVGLERPLRAVRGRRQRVVDIAPSRCRAHRTGRAQIRLLTENDPERRLAVSRDLPDDLGVDRGSARRCRTSESRRPRSESTHEHAGGDRRHNPVHLTPSPPLSSARFRAALCARDASSESPLGQDDGFRGLTSRGRRPA